MGKQKLTHEDFERILSSENKWFDMYDLADKTNPAVQKLHDYIKGILCDQFDSNKQVINNLVDFESIRDHLMRSISKFKVSGLDLSDIPEEAWTNAEIYEADLSYTGAKINPQLIRSKNLEGVNLQGVDLSSLLPKMWEGVRIRSANLSYTGIKFYPEFISGSDLKRTNLSHNDLSYLKSEDWQYVYLKGANLSYTNLKINPRIIKFHELINCNLTGNDLSNIDEKDWKEAYITGANLLNTGAKINISIIKGHLRGTKLIGCEVTGSLEKHFNDGWAIDEDALPDIYRTQHPQYFVDKNAPNELKEAFYGRDFSTNKIDIFEHRKYLEGKDLSKLIHNNSLVALIIALGWDYSTYLRENSGWTLQELEEISKHWLTENLRNSSFVDYFKKHEDEILNRKYNLEKLTIIKNSLKDLPKNLDEILPDKTHFIAGYSKVLGSNFMRHVLLRLIELNGDDTRKFSLRQVLFGGNKANKAIKKLDRKFLQEYIREVGNIPETDISDPIESYAAKNGSDRALLWYETWKFVPENNLLEIWPKDQIINFRKREWDNLVLNCPSFEKNVVTLTTVMQMYITLGYNETLKLLLETAPKLINSEEFERYGQNDICKKFYKYCEKSASYKLVIDTREETEKIIQALKENKDVEYDVSKIRSDYCGTTFYQRLMEIVSEGAEHLVSEDLNNPSKKKFMSMIQETIKKSVNRDLYDYFAQNDFWNIMTLERAETIFDGVKLEFNQGFRDYFVSKYIAIMKNPNVWTYISKIQRNFDDEARRLCEQNGVDNIKDIGFEEIENYFKNVLYTGIQAGNEELAQMAKNCGYSQIDFEALQKILNESNKREKSSIPEIKGKCQESEYTYRTLKLGEPLNLMVGNLTNCCFDIHKQAQSSMVHGATEKNGRIFIVEKEGELVAQSWIWRNKNLLCFDNIEVNKKVRNVDNRDILSIYIDAAKEFVKRDEEGLELMVKKGEMTYEQCDIFKLRKITVGEGNSDISLWSLKEDKELAQPAETGKFYGSEFGLKDTSLYIYDSKESQRILYLDKDYERISKVAGNVPAIYEDSKEIKVENKEQVSNKIVVLAEKECKSKKKIISHGDHIFGVTITRRIGHRLKLYNEQRELLTSFAGK